MKQDLARCLYNEQVSPDSYRMGLTGPARYRWSAPGQFVMVGLPGGPDPLLKRPFSIHRLVYRTGELVGFEILYKVVGKATSLLAQWREDRSLTVLGPLGKGFSLVGAEKRVFIVGGGIGIAPLYFLAQKLVEKGLHPHRSRVFIGGRSQLDLLCREAFATLGYAVKLTTDDGSLGDQCLITDPVEAALQKERPDIVYACGPTPMLRCMIGCAERHGVACQVSLETVMACGMGACLGCAVAGKHHSEPYLHVCLDGPVFNSNDLDL